jgi:hypothetical protein
LLWLGPRAVNRICVMRLHISCRSFPPVCQWAARGSGQRRGGPGISMPDRPAVGSADHHSHIEGQGITFALPRVRVSVLPGPAMVRFSRGVVRPQFANGGTV